MLALLKKKKRRDREREKEIQPRFTFTRYSIQKNSYNEKTKLQISDILSFKCQQLFII